MKLARVFIGIGLHALCEM